MKKILAYTLAFLSIALASCQMEPRDEQLTGQDGKVTVNLGFDIPEIAYLTRSLGETVDLESNGLWVLVYESGYRCEVVQAENITKLEDGKYTCKLTLSVSENKRNLHFISMAGFSKDDAPYEETRLGSITSANGLDAYWQIRTVSCIPYNVTGSAQWANFLSELKGTTGSITLIRNFAKVTMTNSATDFSLTSFKVFNTPSEGYVTAYKSSGSSTGFVSEYDTKSYNDALSAYPGRMPIGCTLNGYNDSVDRDGASFTSADESQYFYERPVPAETPAFIIIKGKYGSDTDYCYYKINLRDQDNKYYALLRGFRFKVNIEKVTAKGYATVQEAFNSVGSGDVSTSLEFSSITNISDNNCRIFVNATSFTAIKAETIEIKYKFCPDANNTSASAVANNVIDVDDSGTANGVEITVNDPEPGYQPSIALNAASKPDVTVDTSVDGDGWSTIIVKTSNPNNLYKEQTVTIRGRGTNGDLTTVIQRDIHIIVRPTLSLYVEMAQPSGQTYTDELPFGAENDAWINIWMEDELPKSIFPVILKIEAKSLTLTPAPGEQLPVESGQSASTTEAKPTFYFVKTISWSDYSSATAATINVGGVDRKMHKFVSKFKTNTEESATDIYVSNELFNTASTRFTNSTGFSLSPVTPGDWSVTASGEPYAGQTFNATIKASVPEGTTITGPTTVDGSSSNVTASISGTVLTITRTGMSYSSSGFKDLAFATTLSTGSFSYTPKVVVWTAPELTLSNTALTSLSNNAYIMITPTNWNKGSYYIYENDSNQPKLGNAYTDNYSYIWQVKDWNASSNTGKLMNYASGRYLVSTSSNNVSSTSTTTATDNYGTFYITYSSTNSWQIRNSGATDAYLNRHGGGTSTNVGYYIYSAQYDGGSRWTIYQCTVTPSTRPTE